MSETKQAPTDSWRQDHESMRAAASQVVSGPVDGHTLAAGGGLQVPGRESHPITPGPHDAADNIIPGERDATTLTHRDAGAIGGRANGADIVPVPEDAMLDEDTIHDHEIEGGGDAVHHQRSDHHRKQKGTHDA